MVIIQKVNVNVMTREEKGALYDDYLRQSDVLQRENSKIKSEYVINMPEHVEEKFI